MPLFKYTVYTSEQGLRSGEAESLNVRNLRTHLREQGLIPVKIRKITRSFNLFNNIFFSKKVKLKDLVLFSQQLSQMIDADFPIINALQTIVSQANHPILKKVIMEMIRDLEGGESFAKALEKHPKIFPPLFISSVYAAEEGGTLEKTLNYLTVYYEEQIELRDKVISILTYPCIVVVIVLGIVTIMLVYIVPIFASLYKSFKTELPFQTKLLINISNFLINYWPFIIILIFLIISIYKLIRLTRKGGLFIDRNIFKIPVIGKMLRDITLLNFIKTFNTTFEAGVVIINCLENAKMVVKNRAVQELIERIKQKVIGGNTISSEIGLESWFFPPLIRQMITIGEASGALDKMLEKASKNITREIESRIKRLINSIEPLLTIILGTLVLLISIAMYTPLINISKAMFGK